MYTMCSPVRSLYLYDVIVTPEIGHRMKKKRLFAARKGTFHDLKIL